MLSCREFLGGWLDANLNTAAVAPAPAPAPAISQDAEASAAVANEAECSGEKDTGDIDQPARGGTAVGNSSEEWWKRWLSQTLAAAPEHPAAAHASVKNLSDTQALTALTYPLAAFDCLLALVTAHVLQQMSSDDLSGFLDEMDAYVESMSTTAEAKAAAVAVGLEWTLRSYSPQVFALQEFNSAWLEHEHFRAFWQEQIDTGSFAGSPRSGRGRGYNVVRPQMSKNPFQQMVLLIGKGGQLKFDSALTKLTQDYMNSPEFIDQLRVAFALVYPPDLVDLQLALAQKSLPCKVAVAMCRLPRSPHNPQEYVLVIGAHAASNGTDNRAITIAARELAQWHEGNGDIGEAGSRVRLVMAMDANSAANFERKNLEKGAATQSMFTQHITNDPFLTSCWLEGSATAPDHTVRKERTYLQCQWKKTGLLDMSVKDYVLCSAADVKIRAMAINRFNEDYTPLLEPQWETADNVFSADDFMPSPAFPSDHALVVAEVHFLSTDSSSVDREVRHHSRSPTPPAIQHNATS
eukprot:SAG25_NODE_1123_length_3886_cov_1.894904_3_plen_522_part_00